LMVFNIPAAASLVGRPYSQSHSHQAIQAMEVKTVAR
jgi:hypothetical protein